MAHNSDLPESLVTAILDAIRAVVPTDFIVGMESPRIALYSTKVSERNRHGRYSKVHSQYAQMAVRNRDGISPESIAWVVWNNLDVLIEMSKRCGSPFSMEEAVDLQAYAQPVDGVINAWYLNTRTMAKRTIPPISLDGVAMERPRGLRLPFPLPYRYELPTDGSPITSPDNRG